MYPSILNYLLQHFKIECAIKTKLNGLFYGSFINTGNNGLTEYLPDRQEQMMRGRRM